MVSRRFGFRTGLVETLAGIRLAEREIRGTLEALGFAIDGKGGNLYLNRLWDRFR